MAIARSLLVVLVVLAVACAQPSTAPPASPTVEASQTPVVALPTPTPTAPASATVSASAAPTPTAAPTPSPTAAPTAAPTRSAAPTTSPTAKPEPTPAPYCAVADELTPVSDYERHAETYLDWTYRLPDVYTPPDLVSAITGRLVPTPFALVEAPLPADLLLRRGDPSYSSLLIDDQNAVVRKIVYEDLSAMRAAATASGVRLIVLSAYRSYARQTATFDYWVSVSGYERALNASARPGHSEHQLGTTVDFGDGTAAPWEYADWALTPEGTWLREHADEFGFVMSYPAGSSAVTCYVYEPWHYRWVGSDVAAKVMESRLPLRVFQTATVTR